ncbi:hypothetical protein KXX51_007720, partial [Aspergillus fumigatus]
FFIKASNSELQSRISPGATGGSVGGMVVAPVVSDGIVGRGLSSSTSPLCIDGLAALCSLPELTCRFMSAAGVAGVAECPVSRWYVGLRVAVDEGIVVDDGTAPDEGRFSAPD